VLTLIQASYLSVFNWVLTTSAKASIFIVFLLGVKYLMKHRMGARSQYTLWSVLLIGLVLPWNPSSPVSIYNLVNSSYIQQVLAPISNRTTQPTSPVIDTKPSSFEKTTLEDSKFSRTILGRVTQLTNGNNVAPFVILPLIYKLMFWIWFSGILILTAITVIINKQFSNKIEHNFVTDPRLITVFNELKVELKIKADIPLMITKHVNSPSLLGFIHPRLLLPIGIGQTFSLEQINHIFLHELLHFRRKDIMINWLTQVLVIIHWFNPLIWYAFYRMREDQEIACDALAMDRIDTKQSNEYAYTLVKLAEAYSTAPRMASLASLCGSQSQIKKRLMMIRKPTQTTLKWSFLGVVVIGLIAFATFTSAKVDAAPNADQGIKGGQAIGPTNVGDTSSGIIIEDITGPSFKGKVMLIKNPKRVKLAVTKEIGIKGERVSDLVKDMGAFAGINAGGFYDPDGKGNGAFPDGLTMQDGQIVHNNVGNKTVNIVGFDDQGKLVIGNMRASQLLEKHIQEAVTFGPNLIVEGKNMISGDGGWGIAPRTGIGQMADGTVIFVVIDGRQPTWSIGATIHDLMNVFADYHAVNAVNLDGGSSSELVYNGKTANKLWNIFGERYIPTAFVVTSQE